MRKSDAFCVQPNSQKCVTFRHFSGFFGKFSKIIKNHQFEHSRTIKRMFSSADGAFHQPGCYPWLKNVEFSNRYVQRFMMEHDLVWTGKKAYFSTPKHYIPDSAPGFVSIWYSEEPILQLADARNPS